MNVRTKARQRPQDARTPLPRGKAVFPQERMNKTEANYAAHLALLQRAGHVLWYEYESAKLRIGNNCWYTPDFMVVMADGSIEMHEVKGFWRDDARVKIKAVAYAYPFAFRAIKRKGDGWEVEEIKAR